MIFGPHILNVSIDFFSQKCGLCASLGRSRPHKTLSVKCTFGLCSRAFHVTCGLAAGCLFQAGDRPGHISVSCLQHVGVFNVKIQGKQGKSRTRQALDLPDLVVGDLALAKHKVTRRFYWAEVVQVDRKRLLEVDFDDGSFSDELKPEDIMVRLSFALA